MVKDLQDGSFDSPNLVPMNEIVGSQQLDDTPDAQS